jgi:LemA protein
MKKGTIITIVIVVLILIYGFATYNNLVSATVTADTQWKQVEVDYQRRFDLIPNLVESTKGVFKQEQAVFGAIADARTRYSGAVTTNEKAIAAGQLESALGRLLVITENYPQLKSSETIQTLMSQLEGTENRISVTRNRFNQAIQAYNLKVMRFPSSIIASIFGFATKDYFNAEVGAEKAPEVKF